MERKGEVRMSLSKRLREREAELGRPVRVGLAGAGQMGIGFAAQVQRIPGMTVSAIADVLPGRATAAFEQAGITGATEGDDADKLGELIDGGRSVAVTDGRLLNQLPVDVVVD